MPPYKAKSIAEIHGEEEVSIMPVTPEVQAMVVSRQAQLLKETILKHAYANAEKLGKQLVTRALMGSDVAMKELLERTLGKVKEDFNITAKIESKVTVTPERLNEIIQVRAKRIGK